MLNPNVRLMNALHEDGGEFYVAPGDAKALAYVKAMLAECREAEPRAGWYLETRGTETTWHRWNDVS